MITIDGLTKRFGFLSQKIENLIFQKMLASVAGCSRESGGCGSAPPHSAGQSAAYLAGNSAPWPGWWLVVAVRVRCTSRQPDPLTLARGIWRSCVC